MGNILLRRATEADMETLLRFEQGVILAERPYDPTLKNSHIRYYDLKKMIEADHIELLLAVVDGLPVASGYARIEDSDLFLQHRQHAYIGFMYVEPAYRGKGISGKVLGGLKDWARSRQILELRLEVYHQNAAAIRAYEKSGFTLHITEMRMSL